MQMQTSKLWFKSARHRIQRIRIRDFTRGRYLRQLQFRFCNRIFDMVGMVILNVVSTWARKGIQDKDLSSQPGFFPAKKSTSSSLNEGCSVSSCLWHKILCTQRDPKPCSVRTSTHSRFRAKVMTRRYSRYFATNAKVENTNQETTLTSLLTRHHSSSSSSHRVPPSIVGLNRAHVADLEIHTYIPRRRRRRRRRR
ncbi:hypothetical protein K504DRAFT_278553 [Pleomassaria siparia CBS 279.74]|uniref:Uncharacterized protein n=1 Tax=Pleomassaria siparia CBS 279.74 TaxID=1314801 RepID=A0A6G1K9P7_9PLEO|nr:hypothetical protein K504DRAFT_278553 [Pleomassaria siparia CBS 279.74]